MIFITGCARSGTSMVAGIIDRCGAHGGNIIGATKWNPRGQYENDEIRNHVIKPILRLLKADPMGQDPLPDIDKVLLLSENGFPAETRSKIDNIIKKQRMKEPWYFKGAKICMLWPIWMRAYPEAHYIIVRRPDKLIIKSCMRTAFMRRRSTKEEWQEWIDYHKLRFAEMAEHMPVHFVSTLDIVEGRLGIMKGIVEKVGLTWDQKAVEEFVDKRIWGTVK